MELAEKIEGERIILSRIEKREDFANLFFKNIKESATKLYPWLEWAHPEYSIADVWTYLISSNESWKAEDRFTYIIKTSQEDFIGIISATPDNQNKYVVLGYWLSSRYIRHGYMQEAVKLLEKELFNKEINKIIIRTDVGNLKSTNVAKKLGYCFDGIMRQDLYRQREDCFRDINVFSKLKGEYKD